MNAPALFNRPAPQLYWPGETNRCPCCGGKAWTIGRASAECAACDLPLPLAHNPESVSATWEQKPKQDTAER